MRPKCTFSTAVLTLLLITSCNSAEQNADKEIKTDTTTPVSATKQRNETVTGGNRLTKQSLLSYLPQQIGTYKKSGSANLKVADRDTKTGRISHTLSQYYSNGAAGMSLRITDYADDQRHMNTVQKGNIKLSDTEDEKVKHKVYVDENGWYITEMELYRGVGNEKIVTSSDVTVKNPRFSIFLKATPERGTSAMETAALLEIIQNSGLTDLFSLPVPEGVYEASKNEARKELNCDLILPESALSDVCATSRISVVVTDFEKTFNCSRIYKAKENTTNRLIFILTQYADPEMSNKAVAAKQDDRGLKGRPVMNLGENAVITFVDENMYLSVAHENYLIELRSFKESATKNMCASESTLTKLANEIITNL